VGRPRRGRNVLAAAGADDPHSHQRASGRAGREPCAYGGRDNAPGGRGPGRTGEARHRPGGAVSAAGDPDVSVGAPSGERRRGSPRDQGGVRRTDVRAGSCREVVIELISRAPEVGAGRRPLTPAGALHGLPLPISGVRQLGRAAASLNGRTGAGRCRHGGASQHTRPGKLPQGDDLSRSCSRTRLTSPCRPPGATAGDPGCAPPDCCRSSARGMDAGVADASGPARRAKRCTVAPPARSAAAAMKVSSYAARLRGAGGSRAGAKPTSNPMLAAAPTSGPRGRGSRRLWAGRVPHALPPLGVACHQRLGTTPRHRAGEHHVRARACVHDARPRNRTPRTTRPATMTTLVNDLRLRPPARMIGGTGRPFYPRVHA
jgi:hypothetical protein